MENINDFTPVFEGLNFDSDDDLTKVGTPGGPDPVDDNDDDDSLTDDVVIIPDNLDLSSGGGGGDDDEGDLEDSFNKLFSNKTPENKAPESLIVEGASKLLQDIGLYSLKEGEADVTTVEELELLLKERAAETVLTGLVESTPELGRNLVAFVLNKGEDLTKDDLQAFYTSYLQEIDISDLSFSAENEDEARAYLEEKYKEKGLRPSVIKTSLDALDVENALIEEANKYLEDDKKAVTTTKKVEETKEQRAKRLAEEKQFVTTVTTSIKESNWKPEKKQQVASIIKNNEIVDFANEALNDPTLMVKFAELLTYYNKEKKEFNLEALGKKEATKQVEKTKDSIFANFMKSQGSTKTADDSTGGEKPKEKATFRPR